MENRKFLFNERVLHPNGKVLQCVEIISFLHSTIVSNERMN